MPTDIPPPGPERDGEIARLLGVAPNRRAIAPEDGTSSALTEDDPMGAGLGGYKITAEDVRDFCRKHPRYHGGGRFCGGSASHPTITGDTQRLPRSLSMMKNPCDAGSGTAPIRCEYGPKPMSDPLTTADPRS